MTLGMAQADVDSGPAALSKEPGPGRMKQQEWLPGISAPYFHITPPKLGADAGAEGFGDCLFGRKESGEPFVILHEPGKRLLAERNARVVLISLSHTQLHATAVAILEGA